MAYHIITHNGKAHMDEFLASGFLILHMKEEPASVQRLASREIETMIANNTLPANTFVLDAGMKLDPAKNLFDHHQDGNLQSSAMLIFNHFFAHLQNTELSRYVALVSRVDTQGIKSLDDAKTINESKIYWSYAQMMLLRQFEKEPHALLRILVADLAERIDFEDKVIEALAWQSALGNTEVITHAGVTILKYNKQPPFHLHTALKTADELFVDKNKIVIVYSIDDVDAQTHILFRTVFGDEIVNFRKANAKNCLFVHQGGFLLKFTPANDTEWLSLVERSVQK